jgi:hypothetical protein
MGRAIDALTAAGTLDGSELIHVKQGANSRRATTQAIADLAAEGSAAWTLVEEWTNDADGPVLTVEADVTGASEILIEMGDVQHSASVHRIVQVRTTAGGATYYTTSGDYADISAGGALTPQTGYYAHATASSAARSCLMLIYNSSSLVSPKLANLPTRGQIGRFSGDATAITHVRVGGVTGAGSTPTGTLQGAGAAIRIFKR